MKWSSASSQQPTQYRYPFQIIAGQGKGYRRSNLNTAIGPLFEHQPLSQSHLNIFANTNGNLVVETPQSPFVETTGPLNFHLVYNSLSAELPGASFGGWQFATVSALELSDLSEGKVFLTHPDGHTEVLTFDAQKNAFISAPLNGDGQLSLYHDSSSKRWVLYDPGTKRTSYFDSHGRLTTIKNHLGHRTSFSYDHTKNHRLKSVNAHSGCIYKLDWHNATDGPAVTVTFKNPGDNEASTLLTHQWNKQGQLIASYLGVYIVYYTYQSDTYRLSSLVTSDMCRLSFGYSKLTHQLVTVSSLASGPKTENQGLTWSFEYRNSSKVVSCNISDGLRAATQLSSDSATGQLLSLTRYNTAENGYGEQTKTTYRYDPKSNLLDSIVYADGSESVFRYDAKNLNVLTQQILRNGVKQDFYYNTQTAHRPFLISRATTMEEGRVAVQRYGYRAGWLSEDHTLFLLLKQYEISPEGRVTIYDLDPTSKLPTTVRRFSQRTYDISRLLSNQVLPVETLLLWALTQAVSTWQRQDQVFDARGQRTTWTTWSLLDAAGKGKTSFGMHRVQRTLNPMGTVTTALSLQTPIQYEIERQEVDFLQRQLHQYQQTTATANIDTITQYADPAALVVKHFPTGQHSLSFANTGGLQKRKLTFGLDEDGVQVRFQKIDHVQEAYATVTYDSQNQPYIEFRNADGKPWYQISPTGRCTVTAYDPISRVQTHVTFGKEIDLNLFWLDRAEAPRLAVFLELGLPSILDSEGTRRSYDCLNKQGQVRYQIDAQGFITEYRYNNQGLKTASIQYHAALTDQQLQDALAGKDLTLDIDLTLDRAEQFYYDLDGMQIGHADADGYVTQTERDACGNVKKTTRFATPLASTSLTPTFVQPEASFGHDAVTYDFRDQSGRLISQVAANGKLTTWVYFGDNQVHQKTTFATRVDPKWYDNPVAPPEVESSDNDHTLTYEVDRLGRQTKITDSVAGITEIQYTVEGKVTSRIQYAPGSDIHAPTPDTQRGIQTQYNSFQQPTHQANAFVSAKLQEDPSAAEQIWESDSTRSEYSETGLLLKTTDALGYHKFFYYDAEGRVVYTVHEDYSITRTTYNTFSEVAQRTRLGKVVDEAFRPAVTGGIVNSETTVLFSNFSNNEDRTDLYTYNARGQMTEHTDADGFVWQYTYNAFGEKSQAIEPIGENSTDHASRTVRWQYNGRGQVTMKTEQSTEDESLVRREQWRFNNLYGKQTQYTDGAGGVHQTYYDIVGDIESEVDPLGNTVAEYTRDVFGRVLTLTDASNQVTTTEYHDNLHQRIITPPIVSQARTETYNIFSELIRAENTLNQVSQVTHQYDGSVAQATNALNQTTTRGLNLLGQLVYEKNKLGTETTYKRGPLNQLQQKVVDSAAGGLKLTSEYQYNAFSELVQVSDPTNMLTSHSYNKRGQQVEVIRDVGSDETHLNLVKASTFNGLHRLQTLDRGDVTSVAQYTEKVLQDALGRATGKIIDPTGLAISTHKVLDGANRVIARIDGQAHKQFRFYDKAGQQRYKISATGRVVEKTYWPTGKLKSARQYANKIDVSQISPATTLDAIETMVHAVESECDSIESRFYNDSHQIQYLIAANGALTENVYDDVGRIVQTILYDAMVDAHAWLTWTTQDVTNWTTSHRSETQDSRTYRLLNSIGQANYVIDPESYITYNRYNAAGQLIEETRYAARITDAATVATLPLNEVASHITLTPARDRTTYHVYNSLGWPTFLVQGEGVVTRYQYNKQGKRTQTVVFSKKLTEIPSKYSDLATLLQALIADPTVDRIRENEYDAVGRKIKSTDPLGHSEQFEYDARDNQIAHTDRMNARYEQQFDAANRLSKKITPPYLVTTTTPKNDGAGKLTLSESSRSVVLKYSYDNANNKIGVSRDDGQPDARTTKYHYYEDNILQSTQQLNVRVDNPNKESSLKAASRPEEIETLTRFIYRDGRGKPVCIQDANGGWLYNVYGPCGRLRYRVSPRGAVSGWTYNARGNKLISIKYATLLTGLTAYQEKGIPLSIIEGLVNNTDVNNRTKQYTVDKLGRRVKEVAGEIVYASADPKTEALICQTGNPTVTQTFNAFNEVVRTSRLQDSRQNQWSITIKWYDRQGVNTAICDPENFVSISEPDSFAQVTQHSEYATALLEPPEPSLTLSELKQQLQPDAASDRIIDFEYNVRGDKVTETLQHQTVSELVLVDGKPTFSSSEENSVKRFEYDGCARLVKQTEPSGAAQYYYYNAVGKQIAIVGIGRKINGEMRYPLTYLKVNAFGERVVHGRYVNGTTAPVIGVTPVPILPDARDEFRFRWLGTAGRVLVVQSTTGHPVIQTWTRLGHPARQTKQTTNYGSASTTTTAHTIYLFSKCFTYNADGARTKQQWEAKVTSGGGTAYKTKVQEYELNTFGQVTAQADYTEGDVDIDWQGQRAYDPQGRAWASDTSGALIVKLTDLAGYETLQLQNTESGWSVAYASLAEYLSNPSATCEITRRVLNARGQVVVSLVPATENRTARTTFAYSHWDLCEEVRADGGQRNFKHDKRGHQIEHTGPEVTVTHEDGSQTPERPVTQFGYSRNSREVAVKNARGYVTGYVQDEVGNPLQTVLPTGLVSITQTYDLFDLVTSLVTPHMKGQPWQYQRDSGGHVIKAIDPEGHIHSFVFNESGELAYVVKPGNYRYFYGKDLRGNNAYTEMPNGARKTRTFNHKRRLLSEMDEDGYTRAWVRKGGLVIQYSVYNKSSTRITLLFDHDGKGQVIREYTTTAPRYSGPAYLSPAFDPQKTQTTLAIGLTSPQPQVNTTRQYDAGHLVSEVDNTWSKQATNFKHDIMGRRAQQVTVKSGITLLSVSAEYDTTGATLFLETSTGVRLDKGYDAVHNNVSRTVTIDESLALDDAGTVSQTWNTFDEADRALVVGGTRNGAEVKIGAGVLFDYGNSDIRVGELRGNGQKSVITTDKLGRPTNIVVTLSGSPYYNRSFFRTTAGQVYKTDTTYSNSGFTYTREITNRTFYPVSVSKGAHTGVVHVSTRDLTRRSDNRVGIYKSTNTGVSQSGLVSTIEVANKPLNSHGHDHDDRTMHNGYMQFADTKFLRYEKNDDFYGGINIYSYQGHLVVSWVQHGSCYFYVVDHNGLPFLKLKGSGATNVSGSHVNVKTFILNIFDLQSGAPEMSLSVDTVKNTLTSNSQLSSYRANAHGGHEVNASKTLPARFTGILSRDASSQVRHQRYLGEMSPVYPVGLGYISSKGDLVIPGALAGFGFAELSGVSEKFHLAGSSQSSLGEQQQYIVQENDTFESIAQKIMGDERLADLIRQANGLEPTTGVLTQGNVLTIPMVMPSHMTSGTRLPAHVFSSIMHTHLSEMMQIVIKHKGHPNYWRMVFKLVAIAVGLAFGQSVLAGLFIKSISATFGVGVGFVTRAVSATVAAITDIAEQGIAVALGQDKIYWGDVLDVAEQTFIKAGPTSVAQANLATRMLNAAEINAATQLGDMVLGRREEFDLNSVWQSMAMVGIDAGVHALTGLSSSPQGQNPSLTDVFVSGTVRAGEGMILTAVQEGGLTGQDLRLAGIGLLGDVGQAAVQQSVKTGLDDFFFPEAHNDAVARTREQLSESAAQGVGEYATSTVAEDDAFFDEMLEDMLDEPYFDTPRSAPSHAPAVTTEQRHRMAAAAPSATKAAQTSSGSTTPAFDRAIERAFYSMVYDGSDALQAGFDPLPPVTIDPSMYGAIAREAFGPSSMRTDLSVSSPVHDVAAGRSRSQAQAHHSGFSLSTLKHVAVLTVAAAGGAILVVATGGLAAPIVFTAAVGTFEAASMAATGVTLAESAALAEASAPIIDLASTQTAAWLGRAGAAFGATKLGAYAAENAYEIGQGIHYLGSRAAETQLGGYAVRGGRWMGDVLGEVADYTGASQMLASRGLFSSRVASAAEQRLVASSQRLASDPVNARFISARSIEEGWQPPFPSNASVRQISLSRESLFYRVHPTENAAGGFIAREREILPYLSQPEALRVRLGLPTTPQYISEVNVPAHTMMIVGKIGPQPAFGLNSNSGFQYLLEGTIPTSSFTNTRPLLEFALRPGM